jgi:Short C-terminal domain
MPRGGFGRGFGRGFGMRRFGAPLVYPMGGYGMGSPLLNTLMAGGLGYMIGSSSAQQAAPQAQPMVAPPYQPYPYQPYPYQPPPAPAQAPTSGADSGKLAQLKLLGELHDSGTLTDDEFESEKQRILRS